MDEKSIVYDYVVKNEPVWSITTEEYKKLSLAKSLFIPQNVNKIYIDIDNYNSMKKLHLERIDVDKNNKNYYSNNSNSIIEKKNQRLVFGCKNTLIPNKVRVIDDYAFCNSDIKEILIPKNVVLIGHGAFQYCNKLKKVIIGNGLKTIGRRAFYSCCGLESIKIPGNVKEIGRQSFSCCKKLKDVKIENGIEYIGIEAFFRCVALENIKIPGSIKSIGFEAFRVCSNLKTVIIENGVEYIGHDAFSGCNSLKQIDIPNSVQKIGNNGLEKSCYIGEELIKRFPNLEKNSDVTDDKEELTLDEYGLFTYYLEV